MTVFLGGTCAGSKWRDEIIPMLDARGIPYFNPVVDDWNADARRREQAVKDCPETLEFYGITSEMQGAFSIFELTLSAIKKPGQTVFYLKRTGFTELQLRSLDAISDRLLKETGLKTHYSLGSAVLEIDEKRRLTIAQKRGPHEDQTP